MGGVVSGYKILHFFWRICLVYLPGSRAVLLYVTSSVKGSDRETNTGGQDRAVNKYTTSLAIFGLHNPWDVEDNES